MIYEENNTRHKCKALILYNISDPANKLILYDLVGFRGPSITITCNHRDLGLGANKANSTKVKGKTRTRSKVKGKTRTKTKAKSNT